MGIIVLRCFIIKKRNIKQREMLSNQENIIHLNIKRIDIKLQENKTIILKENLIHQEEIK
jgi:hypothetical protein